MKKKDTFLRAVHYFADAQPNNFWENLKISKTSDHFKAIKADGFNAVIFVIPWRGFQRHLGEGASCFDSYCLDKLKDLLAIATQVNLLTIVRVGFPWSACPISEPDPETRIFGLFGDHQVRRAWHHYLKQIRNICDASPNFQFAFFSWEDLPSIRHHLHYFDESKRRYLAHFLGYSDFLLNQMSLEQASNLYAKEFQNPADIFIPLPDNAAYPVYNNYVNIMLNSLLDESRVTWPNLTMQFRADFEQITFGDEPAYIENDLRANDPCLRVSYYFLYMYAQCQGETLRADEALNNLDLVLNRVTNSDRNTNHFLDQFVFYDESPQFTHWPKIAEAELGRFLSAACARLKTQSIGYGLWHYFDYRDNHFYNARFLRNLLGWTTQGQVEVKFTDTDEAWAVLKPEAILSQTNIPAKAGNAPHLYERVQFSARLMKSANITILKFLANNQQEGIYQGNDDLITIELDSKHHCGTNPVEFSIQNTGDTDVALTDLYLWGFEMRSHLYNEFGQPGKYLEFVKTMNHV